MIRRDTDYAFRLLAHVAAGDGMVLTAAEICAEQDIPRSFGLKVLRRLVAGKVLKSQAGRGGGFSLARPAGEVTMLDVITIVQGPPLLNRCMAGPGSCQRGIGCPITVRLRDFQDKFDDMLGGTTLADIVAGTSS